MTPHPLFLLVAALTIASPGPGVLLTLTNALRYGFRTSLGGICGIALGTVLVAAASATGLGVLLTASAQAFAIAKLVGAAYLCVLGIRLWRSPPPRLTSEATSSGGAGRRFVEGLSLQATNPKAIVFFLSVFPQFIDPSAGFERQFVGMVAAYGVLVLVIHGSYAATAHQARRWLDSERAGRAINRVGGVAFCCFGIGLATARR